MAKNGDETKSGVISENGCRSKTRTRSPIKDQNPIQPVAIDSHSGANSHIVQKTMETGLIGQSFVTAWAHQCQSSVETLD